MLKEFKEFASRGDAINLAIGVVIGAAFKGVIDSLVNDIIMPPIGYLTARINFANLYIALGGPKYNNLQDAKNAGEVVITYGNFINQLIIFLITAFILFIFVYKFQQLLKKKEASDDRKEEALTKECKYCCMDIKNKAIICPYCQSKV